MKESSKDRFCYSTYDVYVVGSIDEVYDEVDGGNIGETIRFGNACWDSS